MNTIIYLNIGSEIVSKDKAKNIGLLRNVNEIVHNTTRPPRPSKFIIIMFQNNLGAVRN